MRAREEIWHNLMPKKGRRTKKLAKGLPIVKKIFNDLLRERSIIFAITLQVFIILTASIMLTNSVNLFNPDEMLEQETTIAITGDLMLSERLSELFEESDLRYELYTSSDEALRMFEEKHVDGVMSIRRAEELFPVYVDMYVPKGDVKTSIILSETQRILEVLENEMREERLAEPDAIMLDKLRMTQRSNSIATQIFETLYSILIPFLLLMPGVLLGGMVIDILIEELEKKTLNLLMLVISFRRYIFELIIATLAISTLQILVWQILISIQGIMISNLPKITVLVIMMNLIMFIFCIIITLAVMDKTKAQLIYSFMVLLTFASMPLFSINPIRVISRLAIGVVEVSFIPYISAMTAIAAALFISMMFSISGKEW